MYPRRSFIWAAAALVCSGIAAGQKPPKRFVIILIGPSGSGKTTQSAYLQKRYRIPTINIDDLIKQNPEALAKYRETGIDPGTPQSNPALNDLVAERFQKIDISKGVVLDGYPATKDQADHLAALVQKLNLPAPIVIQLDVPDNVDWRRLEKRKREDDTPEQIARRLKDYHREMDFIRSYYPEANIWTIDGTRSAVDVSKTIESILSDEGIRRR